MVKCKYKLPGIGNLGSADGFEPGMQSARGQQQQGWNPDKMGTLGYDGSSVVVGHDMFWTNHDIVSCSDDLASGETDSILLDDLFN